MLEMITIWILVTNIDRYRLGCVRACSLGRDIKKCNTVSLTAMRTAIASTDSQRIHVARHKHLQISKKRS